jgi:hypothetical protein
MPWKPKTIDDYLDSVSCLPAKLVRKLLQARIAEAK